MAKDGGAADPLRNPRFQEPSVWQLFRESLFGKPRLLDCIQVEVTSVCPGRCVYCPHTTQAGYWLSLIHISHDDQVCPAKWRPGAETLKPSLDLVGLL